MIKFRDHIGKIIVSVVIAVIIGIPSAAWWFVGENA